MVKIFKCKYTDFEMFSDAFDVETLYEGFAYRIDGKMTIKGAENYGIGDEEDAGEAEEEKVVDIVDRFFYTKAEYKKKEYMVWAGAYLKKVAAALAESAPERVDGFKAQTKNLLKFIVDNFDNCDFYINDSSNEDGLVVAAIWDLPDAKHNGPVFFYIKDGLVEENF